MMEITIESTVKTTKQIPVPCFWKSGSDVSLSLYGLLDEKTLVSVYESGSMLTITNQEPYEGRIAGIDADPRYNLATEAEFFEAFERVYASLSLRPVLMEGPDTANPINIVLL